MRVGLIIPTLNAGEQFHQLLRQLQQQELPLSRKLILDSSSTDSTKIHAKTHGFEVLELQRQDFNHGVTRQKGFLHLAQEVDIVIFITQDVLLHDDLSLQKLVEPFSDKSVGAAYGRQLPHENASFGAALLRQFSYPAVSRRKRFDDRKELGLRTAFLSDSFAAYRVSALQDIGGFQKTNVCEDMLAAARMLLAGWEIQYAAEAKVHHSHELSLRQSFRRYYDTGIFHRNNPWLLETFGKSEGAGLELLKAQLGAAKEQHAPLTALQFILDDAVKYISYRLGRMGFLE